MARLAVAMSGGVDSAAAAAVLHEAGHEVVGITLQLWDHSVANLAAGRGRCCSPADIADARSTAARLGIAHYVFDHRQAFLDQVVEPALDAWQAGNTPSPCISCNRTVKFGMLGRLAQSLGAEAIATGHYARIAGHRGRPQVRKAADHDKDQTYFLFHVRATDLQDVRFPLGELDKPQVRDIARRLRLPVADKPESYELCFIPDGDKDGFVQARRPSRPGEVRHVDGRSLGGHDGMHRFTVGQRRGLGIAGGERLYVVDLDAATATVTVGPEGALESAELVATACNWIAVEPPVAPVRAQARIRHRHQEAPATLQPLGQDRVRVVFDSPQRAVAPGQGVAFYDGDLLLGGGWISA